MKYLLILFFPLLVSAQISTPADSLLKADSSYVLLVHDTYQIVYSDSLHGPLLCQWVLKADDIGSEARFPGPFYPDTLLPAGWYHARQNDYTGTAYDRGHLVDSKDRTDTHEHNVSTFSTANITPQDTKLNRVTWLALETYCRELTQRGDTLLIVAGVYGRLGTIKHGVAIPSVCWKMVKVLGGPDKGVPTLAVWMPNTASVSSRPWQDYIIGIDQLKKRTGLHFRP
jgi:endonuclease G